MTGKSLQMGGMILAGLALVTGIKDNSMRAEMVLLFAAIGVFTLGWFLVDKGEEGG